MREDEDEDTVLFNWHYRKNGSGQLRVSCERRGIQPFTFYGLRRLRVDTLQRQGIEASVYERIMGHSTRMAQEVYRTPNAKDLQDVVEVDVGEHEVVYLLRPEAFIVQNIE